VTYIKAIVLAIATTHW